MSLPRSEGVKKSDHPRQPLCSPFRPEPLFLFISVCEQFFLLPSKAHCAAGALQVEALARLDLQFTQLEFAGRNFLVARNVKNSESVG